MQERIETIGNFLVLRGEALELFEVTEELLNEAAFVIAVPVELARRNDPQSAGCLDGLEQSVAAVTLLVDDRTGGYGLYQGGTLSDTGQRSVAAGGDYPGHRHKHELWWSSRPASDRSLGRHLFWVAGRMLAGANNGNINKLLFKDRIPLEHFGDAMPYPIRFP